MKDFIGNELKAGDNVVFIEPNYRSGAHFKLAVVVGPNKREGYIDLLTANRWNANEQETTYRHFEKILKV